jgi:hypothetical protein
MIGGPSDVVIEPNIVRAAATSRDNAGARAVPIPETMPRPVPLEEETTWPLQPEPAPRPQRAAPPVAAASWSAASHQQSDVSVRAQHPDAFAELADALAAQTPPRAQHEPAAAPEPQVSAQFATPQTDQHLAEMAQRLEAVLRRPGGGEPRLDVPVTQPPPVGPAVAPDTTAAAPSGAHPAETRPGEAKKFYETLEQEMASLLGRPTGKT